MVFQAVRTRFPLRIAAGMTEWRLLQEALKLLVIGCFLFLGLVVCSTSYALDTVAAGDWALETKGYIKNIISGSETFYGEDYLLDVTRVRVDLNLKYKERLSLRTIYDHEGFIGDYLETRELREIKSADNTDLLDLEDHLLDNRDFLWRHSLYRAYLQYRTEKINFVAGRQRIAWGTGKLWNPTDLFNPFDPLQLEREERKGVDALSGEWFLGTLSSLNIVYAPQRSRDDLRAGLRFRTSYEDWDFSFMGGRFKKDEVVGGDFATTLRDGGLRGEFTYTNASGGRGDFWRALLSYDYTWANSLYALVEYFYNGDPQPEFNYLLFLQNEIATLRKNFLGINLGYDITPIVRAEAYLIYDLDGKSSFLWPRVLYSVTQNVDCSCGVQLFSSRAGSEYDPYSNIYYTQIQYYF
jgi:hypothetical protein